MRVRKHKTTKEFARMHKNDLEFLYKETKSKMFCKCVKLFCFCSSI